MTIVYDITHACNFRCIHCCTSSGNPSQNELSLEEVKTVIKQVEDLGANLIFGGGEPLVRKDFLRILEYASERVPVAFDTNGYLLSQKMIKKIRTFDIAGVGVSIDGIKSNHDQFRGKSGAFERACRAVEYLVNENIPTKIACVITKRNLNEMPDMLKLCRDLEVDFFAAMRLIPQGRAKDIFDNLIPSPQDYRRVLDFFVSEQQKSGKPQIVFSDSLERILEAHRNYATNNVVGVGCEAAKTYIGINPFGDVFPCPWTTDQEFVAGNIRFTNLKMLLELSQNMRMFRDIKELQGKCGDCRYLVYCGGGCRIVAANVTGNLHGSDPHCWIDQCYGVE